MEVPGPGTDVKAVAIVPGYSFDDKGYRLGYGGGYYDVFLPTFGGDSVGFLMKHEQLTYPEALRWLANRYGIEIEGGEEHAESLVTRYPIQIESIYGDTILDNYGMERDIKDGIEPIPLTAEILEKNFTKKGNRYGIYEDFCDFELHEYNDGMWQAVYHNCEISSIPDEQSSVCFVHQLQRMMTDCYCGEDFKIDLEED